ncbi:MAG: carbohydrate ABC transporter permease [Treponema sp.]|uniref:carbohydrate ABC transporter permease n=1 Tax=Treponema sp. TaxID=166 RepID=UPI003FA24E0D
MKNDDKLSAWLFLMPALIFLGITALFPLLYSVYLSFFRLKINLPNQKMLFVGFENYLKLFSDRLLKISTANTLWFAVVSVLCETVLGIVAAMVICSNKFWTKIVTSIFIIPMIMAPVAIGTLWRMMLDASTGIINYFINILGIESISFLSNPKTAMGSVIFVNIWQLTPWVTIITAAALKNLSEETLQAAIVDGASAFQIFRKIVLPLIKPVLVIILMIRFIDAFKVFDTVYVMTGGGPGTATEMLPNYIYKQGLRYFDAGYAASLAIMFVIVMTLCSILFLNWRKKEQENL